MKLATIPLRIIRALFNPIMIIVAVVIGLLGYNLLRPILRIVGWLISFMFMLYILFCILK